MTQHAGVVAFVGGSAPSGNLAQKRFGAPVMWQLRGDYGFNPMLSRRDETCGRASGIMQAGEFGPPARIGCRALLEMFTCLLHALVVVVMLSNSSFAQSDSANANMSHVGNLPVHFFADNEEVADFVAAALTIVNQLAPDRAKELQVGGTMTFISAPDAILNDHMNTDYLWFLTADQKAAVSDNSANGMPCYVQEYVFGEGKPWTAAASTQLEPEFAKMCFLVALRFWMGAAPQDYEHQSLGRTFIGVLGEIVDGGKDAVQ